MKAGSGGYLKGLAGDKGKGIMGVRLVTGECTLVKDDAPTHVKYFCW